MGAAASLLLPVHPRGIACAHHGFTVDVNRGAFQDVVADLGIRLADQAFAHAGLVALYVAHIADLVAVGFLISKVDVFRNAFALAQLVHDRLRSNTRTEILILLIVRYLKIPSSLNFNDLRLFHLLGEIVIHLQLHDA